jgi:hypothetical protein
MRIVRYSWSRTGRQTWILRSSPITHISWRFLVLPFLPSLLNHLAHPGVEARIWLISGICVKNLKQTTRSSYVTHHQRIAKNCSSTEVLPPAAQRMGPSRTPGQDCQGEQVPASAMKAIVNQWTGILLKLLIMKNTCLKNSVANELHSPRDQLSHQYHL